MTLIEQIVTVAMGVLGVQLCRWLPFLAFPPRRPIPKYAHYLGKALPPAMFGLLVVYCYKDLQPLQPPFGLPALIAGAVTLALHFYKGNMFLSIAAGTFLYMFLLQKAFV